MFNCLFINSFYFSAVVSVLKTSKFRRMCNELITSASSPVPPLLNFSINDLLAEKHYLESQGLLDSRGLELFDYAYRTSQVCFVLFCS